jgi:predicted CXXCH cytochrome family protein
VNCESCHGPASQHNGTSDTISKTHWPGNCGQCHDQFAQWQKSRHSDPLAFGHAEIAGALLGTCYKCHYTEGFIGAVESAEGFHDFKYPLFPAPDVPKDTPNVSCDVCHDPHVQSVINPVGIRTGSEESLCGTCHEQKWQNATYTATGDEIGNAYHWTDYTQYQGTGNPHQMPKGCVTCHMAKDITDTDAYGVRKVGAHSLRMRDVGPDGDPGTADDLLNIAICQTCHSGLTTFDRNSTRTRIKNKLDTLGNLLKVNNHDYLPPFQPGKCATCHRGGTLPFINDTETKTLENAYLNYKLILHDRSFGVHNPGYIERLLDDSISAILDSDNDGIFDLEDNCPDICNPEQLDADNDGEGDLCDTTPKCGGVSCGIPQPACETECIVDTDGDGIPDLEDNCPLNCNTEQSDYDGDGAGDVCDTDGKGCSDGCGSPSCEQEC